MARALRSGGNQRLRGKWLKLSLPRFSDVLHVGGQKNEVVLSLEAGFQ